MVRTRHLALLLGTLALVGTVVSAGGYSAMGADRQVDISTAPDSEAYLGVDVASTATDGGGNLTVQLTNRFAEPLTTVEVTADGEIKTLADHSLASLDGGESVTFTFATNCTTVGVVASGDTARVTLERTCS